MLPELPWTVRVKRTPWLLRLFGFKPWREVRVRQYAHIGGSFEDREVTYHVTDTSLNISSCVIDGGSHASLSDIQDNSQKPDSKSMALDPHWQPMATAPKDRRIFACSPRREVFFLEWSSKWQGYRIAGKETAPYYTPTLWAEYHYPKAPWDYTDDNRPKDQG